MAAKCYLMSELWIYHFAVMKIIRLRALFVPDIGKCPHRWGRAAPVNGVEPGDPFDSLRSLRVNSPLGVLTHESV